MKKEILTRHPVTLHVEPTPYQSGAWVWKCRNKDCNHTMEDDNRHFDNQHPILCDLCKEVMDYTPVRHTKGSEQ